MGRTATMNSLVTNDSTPTLTGTVNDTASGGGITAVTVVVDGQTLTATVSGTAWSRGRGVPARRNLHGPGYGQG